MTPDLPAIAEHYLLDPEVVFLNHGSYGACARPVLAAQRRWQDEMERNPVHFLGRRSAGLLAEARGVLAAYVGARARDLVFIANATTGVNAVAESVALGPGDEVLATDHEYGACDAAWQRRCARAGATYRRVAIPLPFERERFAEQMLAACSARTKLVFASHITSTSALVFPVAELVRGARARGIATLVDGAHAPGQVALALDAIGADFYVGNCHKWMGAPKGCGFLHVREERQAAIESPVVSWGYVAGAGGHTGFDAYTGASTLERRLQWLGTRDLSAFLAVPAAIEFMAANHWPERLATGRRLALALMHELAARHALVPIAPDEDFAQMVPIPVPHADAEALRRALFEGCGIEVPVTRHGGRSFVRVAMAAYNTAADLDALRRAAPLATAG